MHVTDSRLAESVQEEDTSSVSYKMKRNTRIGMIQQKDVSCFKCKVHTPGQTFLLSGKQFRNPE